jgi:hypothetical protein
VIEQGFHKVSFLWVIRTPSEKQRGRPFRSEWKSLPQVDERPALLFGAVVVDRLVCSGPIIPNVTAWTSSAHAEARALPQLPDRKRLPGKLLPANEREEPPQTGPSIFVIGLITDLPI